MNTSSNTDSRDVKVQVGLRIKELRGMVGLSQDDLAFAIEMSRSYLAEIETGKRNVSIENIERIARGLGVSLPVFFNSPVFKTGNSDDSAH